MTDETADQIALAMLGYQLIGMVWFLACYLTEPEVRRYVNGLPTTGVVVMTALAAMSWMPVMLVSAWRLVWSRR